MEYLPEYNGLRSLDAGFSEFWSKIYEGWFRKFPERNELFPGSTEAELSEEDTTRLGNAIEARRHVSY